MPPPPLHTGLSLISTSTASNNGLAALVKISLLVFAVAASIRFVRYRSNRTKNNISAAVEYAHEKGSPSCTNPTEKELPDRPPQNQVQDQTPTFKPIYPWITPPHPLPGPYDPNHYPLPSVRRHSSVEKSSPEVNPEKANTISYTRRVSTNSIPIRHSTLHGTITTSHQGWRRNLWVVPGG